MTDTSSSPTPRPTPGLGSMTGGGALAGAVCGVLIFHVNQIMLHYGLTPIPTEIAAQYQIIFAGAGGWVGHCLSRRLS